MRCSKILAAEVVRRERIQRIPRHWNRRNRGIQRNSLLGDVPQVGCFQEKEQGIEGEWAQESGAQWVWWRLKQGW